MTTTNTNTNLTMQEQTAEALELLWGSDKPQLAASHYCESLESVEHAAEIRSEIEDQALEILSEEPDVYSTDAKQAAAARYAAAELASYARACAEEDPRLLEVAEALADQVAEALDELEEEEARALCDSLVASQTGKQDDMYVYDVRAGVEGPLIAEVSLRANEAGILDSWGDSLSMWCAISDYAERSYTMESTAMADLFAAAVIEACNEVDRGE